MKRICMLCMVLALLCMAGFSEDNSDIGCETEALPENSVLNLKLLIHEPGFFNFTRYQTPAGEAISYKETNALLNSLPKNNKVMKQHRFWRGASFVFAGMLAACIATDVVYMCDDDLPHKNAVVSAASSMGLCSAFAAILSGDASTARYLIAVDNYNMNVLSPEQ